MAQQSHALVLSSLAETQFGLSAAKAHALVEAATVCLHHQQHGSGVALQVSGLHTTRRLLEFCDPDRQALRAHADPTEAVEDGATAVAIAVVTELTEYRVVERSYRGTGFDWWLGREEGVFEARLEVSGILAAPDRVGSRVEQKLRQLGRSDALDLPGYAAVVEFSAPEARIVEKL